ncbi:MAG: hypothetical protein IPK83_24230 [Planctomycetes bacterium]|nr:hypothetical protein [Planctomycetota bacterium]
MASGKKTTPAPIDFTSKAGRAAAWAEVKAIIERALDGNGQPDDTDRLSGLANVLEISSERINFFRGALKMHRDLTAELAAAQAVIDSGECDRLEREFEKTADKYREMVAERMKLRERVEAAQKSIQAAGSVLTFRSPLRQSIECAFPALFRGEEFPDSPSPELAREIMCAVGHQFNAFGEMSK